MEVTFEFRITLMDFYKHWIIFFFWDQETPMSPNPSTSSKNKSRLLLILNKINFIYDEN